MSRAKRVGLIALDARRGEHGQPVWIADGKHEAPTAEAALAKAGAELDFALAASLPEIFGWGST